MNAFLVSWKRSSESINELSDSVNEFSEAKIAFFDLLTSFKPVLSRFIAARSASNARLDGFIKAKDAIMRSRNGCMEPEKALIACTTAFEPTSVASKPGRNESLGAEDRFNRA